MLAACQGRHRTQSLAWADDLKVAVRLDRPGRVITDFHTAGGGLPREQRMRTGGGKQREDAEITRRDYLADASFVVTVTGDDDTVQRLASSLTRPVFTPFLGRKSCPPSLPPLVGVSDEDPLQLLGRLPAHGHESTPPQGDPYEVGLEAMAGDGEPLIDLRVMTEDPEFTSTVINDRPLDFNHWSRKYAPRNVGETLVSVRPGGGGLTGALTLRQSLATEG